MDGETLTDLVGNTERKDSDGGHALCSSGGDCLGVCSVQTRTHVGYDLCSVMLTPPRLGMVLQPAKPAQSASK
jgi:hypothetical protein